VCGRVWHQGVAESTVPERQRVCLALLERVRCQHLLFALLVPVWLAPPHEGQHAEHSEGLCLHPGSAYTPALLTPRLCLHPGSAYTPALLTPRLCFLLPREAAAAVAAAKAVAEAAAAAERLRLEEVLAALATRMQSDALMMQQVQSQLGVPPAAPARHPETVTHLGHLSALATMSSMTSGLRQVRSASPRGRAPGG
jgi:hypothetical protein